MKVPIKVWITIGIIAGIGVGTGSLTIGVLLLGGGHVRDEAATMMAVGATLLASSAAALVAHLAGAFRDIRED